MEHRLFADWLSRVYPGHDADLQSRRWICAEAALAALTLDNCTAFICFLMGLATPSPLDFQGWLSKMFKGADPTFLMKENDELLRVLAGAAIAQSIQEDSRVAIPAALALTSASCQGVKDRPIVPT